MPVRRIVEEAAREIHECWVERHRTEGLTSRLSPWGEELMVSWEELSERAKDLNREMVVNVFRAFARLVE